MKLIEIPELFQSYESGGKFSECLVCKKNLLEENTHYLVEKAIRNYPEMNSKDVIFEYAMCFECADKLKDELSEESFKKITEYFEKNVDLNKRFQESVNFGDDYQEYISNCMVTNQSINELNEYAIEAHCIGDKMALSFMPYMISEQAMDGIADLLSNKTLNFLNGFMDDYFAYPPEFRELFTRRLILI
ncbi:hypothetical protein ACFLSQ_00310 [Bacteroidota bacterium]